MNNTMNGLMSMYSDPSAVAAAESAKARIQSAYMMAMHQPRNYDNARVKILAACKRPDFAEKVEYKKPVGGQTITGASIRFIELALREWGNILYENQVVYDDDNVRRIRVTVIDLQTNATFGKEIQLSKTVERKSSKGREVLGERTNSYGEIVYIVKATEDETQIREAALISKALRNEGARLIPQEIIEEALATAQATMKDKDKKDPSAARNKLIDAFASIGIMPIEIEKYLGHPLMQVTVDEVQELRGMFSAIKDGEAKWADYVHTDEPSKEEQNDDMKSKLLGDTKKKKEQAPQPSTDLDKLIGLLGTSGLGLTEPEQAEWCEYNFKISNVTKFTPDQTTAAIEKINAELKTRM